MKDAQTTQFAEELDKLIDRFRVEYDVTYATIVGSLYMKAHLLCDESQENCDDE